MNSKSNSSFVVALGLLLAAPPLAAHHGAGLFEPEKKVTTTGTVTDFQFVNPHVLVFWTVKGNDGKDVAWSGELTSPNRLARMEGAVAWHKSILKPGDRVTLEGHPARNGAPVMDITRVVDAQGAVLISD
jgi:Family of unknown function (DUF6152)